MAPSFFFFFKLLSFSFLLTSPCPPFLPVLLAVSADWLDDQYEKLKKQPWFRPKPYNRKDAEDELAHKPLGSFVVRVSSQEGHYAVSFVRKNGTDHMLILPSYVRACVTLATTDGFKDDFKDGISEDDEQRTTVATPHTFWLGTTFISFLSQAGVDSASPGKTQYRIGTYSTDLFNTVPKLVAYYIGQLKGQPSLIFSLSVRIHAASVWIHVGSLWLFMNTLQ